MPYAAELLPGHLPFRSSRPPQRHVVVAAAFRDPAWVLLISRGARKCTAAPVAQGIEHRPPEAGAQVRILPGALPMANIQACPDSFSPSSATTGQAW